ncbi:ubiquitin-2 like Rad60 SUMO-like-domain-containing protein [Phaeosphaeria sp. MPI-PUGE-AT-0046c]|nr:ubiquitin-2 like Rad60 SUMO-like-domain-containing protein [Phaeosphaeria sp. MPI-PUGE-AT-0046c]
MTDSTPSAPAPKKRSLFKRSAWQDTPKTEEDMFSHASQFEDIVADQTKIQAEKRAQADAAKKQKRAAGPADRKRRKTSSSDHEEITMLGGSPSRADRANSKARSRTPRSPRSPPHPPGPSHQLTRTESVVIDLGDSDDDDVYPSSVNTHVHATSQPPWSPIHAPAKDDAHVEEVLDPTLAALAARARERAAARARSTALLKGDGETAKAPVAQLFISPEIPDAKPLMVKVRIDSTLERTRLAWCNKQGYTSEMTRSVFFTWKDERVYDSTTIQRLGIQVGRNGILSVEGDSNIYDDVNHPKIYVQAWTDALFQQHKREKTARKKAAEPPPVVEKRTPTPETVPEVKKIRLIMKARGMEDYRLSVNPDSTFAHIAHAYKKARGVDESQPITLMFDGDRLVPMDTIAESEVEDMDSIDVLFK